MNHYLKYYLIGAASVAVYLALTIGFKKETSHREVDPNYWTVLRAIVFWPYFTLETFGQFIGFFFRK